MGAAASKGKYAAIWTSVNEDALYLSSVYLPILLARAQNALTRLISLTTNNLFESAAPLTSDYSTLAEESSQRTTEQPNKDNYFKGPCLFASMFGVG